MGEAPASGAKGTPDGYGFALPPLGIEASSARQVRERARAARRAWHHTRARVRD